MLIASSALNVGFATFDTSSNWLMTSLNPNPMMVSAVQVATTLPMFLLTLPAGALTGIVDPRRMLIGAQLAVTAISIVFAAAVTSHGQFDCAAGDGILPRRSGALAAPGWLVITPMPVPKHDLDSAIAINNTSYNVSRAVAPALAGLAIAAFSIAFPFRCFCAGNIAVLAGHVVARSAPRQGDPSRERLRRARHRPALARNNRYIDLTLIRSSSFSPSPARIGRFCLWSAHADAQRA